MEAFWQSVEWITDRMKIAGAVCLVGMMGLTCADVIGRFFRHPIFGSVELVGFISERDCLASMSESLYYSNPARNAAAVMRSHPVCVAPDTELYTLCSIFVQHGYRHLPVVDQERGLVGMVSRRDVLLAMRDYERNTLRATKQERKSPTDLREILNLRFVPESHG